MDRCSERALGALSLLLATVIWGSSFVVLKSVVTELSSASYVFYRGLAAAALLAPPTLSKALRGSLHWPSVRGGLVTGVAYALGLFLQGAGTKYTTPSLSAFITGLSTLHVCLYRGIVGGGLGAPLLLALAAALAGLYLVTEPTGGGGVGLGELLVLLGSVAWAAQILLVARYSGRGLQRLEFLQGMVLPSLMLGPLALHNGLAAAPEGGTLLGLLYLASLCTIAASYLQVLGQSRVGPATAAITFSLEPFFALLFSVATGAEALTPMKLVGGGLMVAATYVALRYEEEVAQRRPRTLRLTTTPLDTSR